MKDLFAGTVMALYYQQKENPLYSSPMLQIITANRHDSKDGKIRYKVNLSDGKNFIPGILSTDVSMLFENKSLSLYDIIKLERFDMRQVNKSSYIYVTGIQLSITKNDIIGTPEKLSLDKNSLSLNNATVTQTSEIHAEKAEPESKKMKKSTNLIAIKNLNPFLNSWTIQGRIVRKTPIRKFKRKEGEGQLFSFEITDSTMQCKVVAFNDAVDVFFPIIENNKVYRIKDGLVKMANKQFSSTKFDYEIHIEKTSLVEQCEDSSVPEYTPTFTAFSDLGLKVNEIVDVIGIIHTVYPVSKIIIKSSGNEIEKRDMWLIDETGSIKLTVWNDRATEEYEKGSVFECRYCKVGSFNGVTLSTISTSEIITNRESNKALKLLQWYRENGQSILIPQQSESFGEKSLIAEMIESNAQICTVKATLMFLKEDNWYYLACPEENCRKKLVTEEHGNYRCEKCNYTYDHCNYMYLVTAVIADYSGQTWVTMFNYSAEKLLEKSAKDMIKICEGDPDEMISLFKSKLFQEYSLRIRIREDNLSGELRKRFQIIDLKPLDYQSELSHLANTVKAINE